MKFGGQESWKFYRVDWEGLSEKMIFVYKPNSSGGVSHIDDSVGDRKDGWMDDGWMEGREGGKGARGRLDDGWMDEWMDWVNEWMNTWIVLIYADDLIYLHHYCCSFSCLAICIPPVLQCQSLLWLDCTHIFLHRMLKSLCPQFRWTLHPPFLVWNQAREPQASLVKKLPARVIFPQWIPFCHVPFHQFKY